MTEFPSILAGNEHDLHRLSLVHPADYQNPEPREKYNLVVLGAGSAGLITSLIAASLGARVALVERELLGGACPRSSASRSPTRRRSTSGRRWTG